MNQPRRSRMQLVELVATFGVLISLVFVALELRQNTAVARGQARNDLATLAQEFLLLLGQDPVANRAWRGHWQDEDVGALTPTDRSQAYYLMIAMVRRLETTYLHHRESLIPEAALESYGMRSPVFDGPRFRTEFWPRSRGMFDPDFTRYFEARLGL